MSSHLFIHFGRIPLGMKPVIKGKSLREELLQEANYTKVTTDGFTHRGSLLSTGSGRRIETLLVFVRFRISRVREREVGVLTWY